MLYNVWKFLKNPKYLEYKTAQSRYKKVMFFSLLKWMLLLAFSIAIFNGALAEILNLEFGEHATEKLFSQYSIWIIFLLVSIAAPCLEEFLFRGPLVFFKNSPYFKHAFYTSILLFGLVHIFNFKGDLALFYFAPLLIAPQLMAGVFLGYIRVKLGLRWSILLHATFNTVLLGPVLMLKILNIPLE
ncbi:CPBP family intramembrane glutamic endopeptidase [Sediminicola sp. 1XM1-17]|uniref:CPBP family intramembrane glutamic endopeptidase n=1 Tax=Sediminicola sp. 1XM1-17 TaxID=3127702 RepID=UPI00307876D7